ncbi:MAG TPA: D-aminoacyl-tRNA deacylase [Gammaproteobacteria bacterium]|nr:D-aminoacyl-tRNA deacylase [Gammaproteobacteria bacterium]
MIGLLQRVSRASVAVNGDVIAEIGRGLLVLIGVERTDRPEEAERLAERLLGCRVFPDEAGRMNLAVRDVGGSVLLVPQFTLAADTSSGHRPGFARAAEPGLGEALFNRLVEEIRASGVPYAVGRFGAHMQVTLTNDGPVTFWLHAGAAR